MLTPLLGRVAGGSLARGALWMLGGQGVRIGVQALYFVVIARALGPSGYGDFVGVVALAALLAPFASMGAGNLLVRHAVRDPASLPRHWGNALVVTLGTGAVLAAVATLTGGVALPRAPWLLVLAVALADVVGTRIVDVAGQAYQATRRLDRTALLQALPSACKLVAAGVFALLVDRATATAWALCYLAATAAAAIVAVAMATRELARPRPAPATYEWREGFYFAAGLSAQNVYNDADKAILLRLAGSTVAGLYGAAYRAVDMAFVPMRALLFAAYDRFFAAGRDGVRGSARWAVRLVPPAALLGLGAGLALVLGAPLLPRFLGVEYAESAAVARWLAPLPALKALHYLAADALTGAGWQGTRTVVQGLVAALNVGGNLLLVPQHGWRGAAWMSLASDGALALVLWALVWRLARAGAGRAPVGTAVPDAAGGT